MCGELPITSITHSGCYAPSKCVTCPEGLHRLALVAAMWYDPLLITEEVLAPNEAGVDVSQVSSLTHNFTSEWCLNGFPHLRHKRHKTISSGVLIKKLVEVCVC